MLIKSLTAAGVMSAAAYYFKNQVNLILTIILAGLSYFMALYIFKGFSREDVVSIYKSFIKVKV